MIARFVNELLFRLPSYKWYSVFTDKVMELVLIFAVESALALLLHHLSEMIMMGSNFFLLQQ